MRSPGNSCSVPNVVAQNRAPGYLGANGVESLACVVCGRDIRSGSWCNACRDAATTRLRSRGAPTSRVAAHLADSDNCDCGRRRPACAETCSRCAWLDRRSHAQARLVDFLRTQRWATMGDMLEALGICRRPLERTVEALMATGRLVREWEELDDGLDGMHRGGSARYVYRLTS